MNYFFTFNYNFLFLFFLFIITINKTGCRWTCVDNEKGYDNCEYDLCCNCAGNITQKDVERWERRVDLLASLAQQPKRWWLDPRSDPSIVAINSRYVG